MKRPLVKDATMRMKDVREGDVVSRTPNDREGWFQVAVISRMFNGKIQVTDASGELAVSGHDFDLIGIQIVTELPLPAEEILETGVDAESDDDSSTDDEPAAEAEAETTEPPAHDEVKEPAMAGGPAPESLAPPEAPSSLAPPASLFADRRAAE